MMIVMHSSFRRWRDVDNSAMSWNRDCPLVIGQNQSWMIHERAHTPCPGGRFVKSNVFSTSRAGAGRL
jgi:hypothetical protein